MTQLNRRPVRSILVGAAAAVAAIAALAIAPLPASAASTYSIGGTVTYQLPGGSTATPSGALHLYPASGSSAGTGGSYTASTVSSGVGTATWSVANVPAGRYRVEFDATSASGTWNAATWLGNTPVQDQGTVITVDHNLTGLDVTQPLGGSISGTLAFTGIPAKTTTLQAWLWDKTSGLFERVQGVSGANSTGTGNYTIRGLNAGDYVVRFADEDAVQPSFSTQYYQDADIVWQSTLVTVGAGQDVSGIDGSVADWSWYHGRLAGGDRFETSAAISSEFYAAVPAFGTGPDIYVANGVVFPDALSASAAAAWAGGPLLLTRQDFVPASIVTEIKRINPSSITVVGGVNAVGAAAYAQLQGLSPNVTRVSGNDRYATSRAVIQNAFTGQSSTNPRNSIFIATGNNFPDALVAGSAAGYEHGPLLLVSGGAASLDPETKALITSFAPKRVYIVGGVNSVSPGIQADLGTLGIPSVLRLSGGDRFATAQAVNKEVFPFADTAYVASGLAFPDALSISAVAGALGSPLLLAPPQCLPYGEVVDSTELGVSTYWVVGGVNALSDDVYDLTVCPQGMYGSSAPLSAKSDDGAIPNPQSVQPADPSTLRGTLQAAKELQNKR